RRRSQADRRRGGQAAAGRPPGVRPRGQGDGRGRLRRRARPHLFLLLHRDHRPAGAQPADAAIRDVPQLRADAVHEGRLIRSETFAWLREILVEGIRRALPVDGVLLALHGALVADAVPDVEGEILQSFRQVIGPRVPLVATLDLHANVTARMARHADALVLYH